MQCKKNARGDVTATGNWRPARATPRDLAIYLVIANQFMSAWRNKTQGCVPYPSIKHGMGGEQSRRSLEECRLKLSAALNQFDGNEHGYNTRQLDGWGFMLRLFARCNAPRLVLPSFIKRQGAATKVRLSKLSSFESPSNFAETSLPFLYLTATVCA